MTAIIVLLEGFDKEVLNVIYTNMKQHLNSHFCSLGVLFLS